jgi:two-component system, OmpR family, alkaline phosphatase synthesis response regulator PhoP
MTNVCFVDDELNIRRLVAYDLKAAGYATTLCENGQDALNAALTTPFDVMIVDWMMPQMDGLTLVKRLREAGQTAIVIMLTAKSEEEDLIEAFEAGVDDYLTKPFSSRELMVRIKAHLNRTKPTHSPGFRFPGIFIDLLKRTVTLHDLPIELTKTEFDLLVLFAQNVDQVLSRDTILNTIWGFEYDGDTRIVDVHVFKLRSKLAPSVLTIKSSRGVGYWLEVSRA